MRGCLAAWLMLGVALTAVADRAHAAVIYDTFPGIYWPQGVAICGSESTVSRDEDIAVFFIPTGNRVFQSAELALHWYSGTNAADVYLMSDSGGKPAEVLESFHLVGLPQGGVAGGQTGTVTVSSVEQPHLAAGTMYWIMASSSGTSFDAWKITLSTRGGHSSRSNNGNWVAESGFCPALRVNAIPEPATAIMGLVALAGLAMSRKPVA